MGVVIASPQHLRTSDQKQAHEVSLALLGFVFHCERHIKARSDLLSPQVKSWESAYRLRCDQRQKSLLQPHRLDHMTGRFDLQSDVELPDPSCEICCMAPFVRPARCFDT